KDNSKITRKQSKIEQARIRESEEYKKKPKDPEPKPEKPSLSQNQYGYIKTHKKTVKNGQARTRESEEYKKKPKNQSRSQKSQASCPQFNQTDEIQALMIEGMNGDD
ncbi:hypothetical protein Tco_1519882, partial [Tanacetum coccineum]